jgi:hypothetical protein
MMRSALKNKMIKAMRSNNKKPIAAQAHCLGRLRFLYVLTHFFIARSIACFEAKYT